MHSALQRMRGQRALVGDMHTPRSASVANNLFSWSFARRSRAQVKCTRTCRRERRRLSDRRKRKCDPLMIPRDLQHEKKPRARSLILASGACSNVRVFDSNARGQRDVNGKKRPVLAYHRHSLRARGETCEWRDRTWSCVSLPRLIFDMRPRQAQPKSNIRSEFRGSLTSPIASTGSRTLRTVLLLLR